jgi:dihydroxyacetone kinase
MDALIPFVHVLKNGGTFDEAVTEAEEKALATGKLTAKLGRATYVDQGNTVDVPDPGAMAIAAIVRGLRKGSS